MENYEKGETKEVEDEPVFTATEGCVNMRVSGGSKIRNLMGYAMKKVKEPDTKCICWNGSGNAVTKTVGCAEIMKRKIKGLHQITKIRYRRVEEYWEPKVEGLERLKVNKDIPAISILLSKDPLDKNEPGYQPPGSFEDFWKEVVMSDKATSERKKRANQSAQGDARQFKRDRKNPNGRKMDSNRKWGDKSNQKGKGGVKDKQKEKGGGKKDTNS